MLLSDNIWLLQTQLQKSEQCKDAVSKDMSQKLQVLQRTLTTPTYSLGICVSSTEGARHSLQLLRHLFQHSILALLTVLKAVQAELAFYGLASAMKELQTTNLTPGTQSARSMGLRCDLRSTVGPTLLALQWHCICKVL